MTQKRVPEAFPPYAFSHEHEPRKLWDEDDMRDYAAHEAAPLIEALQQADAQIVEWMTGSNPHNCLENTHAVLDNIRAALKKAGAQ